MRLEHKPEFRRTARHGGADPSDEPGDGGGRRALRSSRRQSPIPSGSLTCSRSQSSPALLRPCRARISTPMSSCRKKLFKGVDRTGLRDGVFHDLRFNVEGLPDESFILNRPGWTGASFLVVGPNFGCGSAPRARGVGTEAAGHSRFDWNYLRRHLFRQLCAQRRAGYYAGVRAGCRDFRLGCRSEPKSTFDRLAGASNHFGTGPFLV